MTPTKKETKAQGSSSAAQGLNSCVTADHLSGRFQFEQRVRHSVVLEELANRKAIHRIKPLSKEDHRGIPLSQSHPNLKAMEKAKEVEDSAEMTYSDDDKLDGDSVDLKGDLEETDLLAGVKSDSETLEASAFQTKTSLPWIKTSSISGTVVEDMTTASNPIDSQVSIEDISFVGHPRAMVVAPEINTNGGREYVVFKIRVADQTGEWTVTRRYRNFEALHKFLRDDPVYQELQPRLPPKAFMFQTHKTEVVEQRRIALDKYLQTILSSEALAGNRHVWLFLSDQACRSFTPDVKVGLVKTIANNVDTARYRIKRTIIDTLGEGNNKLWLMFFS